jgi:hypothetical protein
LCKHFNVQTCWASSLQVWISENVGDKVG